MNHTIRFERIEKAIKVIAKTIDGQIFPPEKDKSSLTLLSDLVKDVLDGGG